MLDLRSILAGASALAVAALLGCGQKGPLYLPTPPAGVERPTLPQIIRSSVTGEPATPPASAASAAPRMNASPAASAASKP